MKVARSLQITWNQYEITWDQFFLDHLKPVLEITWDHFLRRHAWRIFLARAIKVNFFFQILTCSFFTRLLYPCFYTVRISTNIMLINHRKNNCVKYNRQGNIYFFSGCFTCVQFKIKFSSIPTELKTGWKHHIRHSVHICDITSCMLIDCHHNHEIWEIIALFSYILCLLWYVRDEWVFIHI